MGKSDWTIETLKEYIFSTVKHLNKRYNQRFEAQEKAVEKSETAQNNYNIRSNEFRQAIDDSNKIKIDRTEVEGLFTNIEKKIETMKSDFIRTIDKINDEIRYLRDERNKDFGKDQDVRENRGQKNWSTGILIAVVIALISLFGTIIMFILTYKH